MRLIFEIVIYYLVYILMIKVVKKNNPVNCLFFYPKPVKDKMYELGLADEKIVNKREKVFYTWFLAILILLLFVFIVVWNKRQDFKVAFMELYIILAISNWFDGIVIDKLWVSQKSWIIPETIGIPHVKSWKTILVRRTLGMIVYIPIAAIIAFIFEKISIIL